jgi:hypothetical protein
MTLIVVASSGHIDVKNLMLSCVHHWVGFNSYQSCLRIHEMIDKVSEQQAVEALGRTKELAFTSSGGV